MGLFQSKIPDQTGGRKRYKDYDITQYLKKNSEFSEFEQMKNKLMAQFGGADKNIDDADFDDFIQALQNSTEINIQTGGKASDTSSASSISFASKNSSDTSSGSSSSSSSAITSEISGLASYNNNKKNNKKTDIETSIHERPEKYSNTEINIMPFYSSSESPTRHPYIKRRFKN